MTLFELFLLAVGLSMDAFAVGICMGLTMKKSILKKAFIIGLYFGIFQAVMPLIGYMTAIWFADIITFFDHWIAFGLLCFLGGKMIWGSFKKEEVDDKEASLTPAKMLPFALATSIDALAVGISFAFLQADIIPAVSFIGVTTFILSMIGVKTGNLFGIKFKSQSEFAGGIILALIGFKILFGHLSVFCI